jgi:hypothetical protein
MTTRSPRRPLAPARIVLNLAEIARLAQQQPINFAFGAFRIELTLQAGVTPKLVIAQMMDLLTNGGAQGDGINPSDPPEAREFLPRRKNHRNRK